MILLQKLRRYNVNKKILSILLVLLLGAVFLVGCEPQSEEEEINLGYVNWAEGIAMTFLAEAIIEDELGYAVNNTMADVGPTFQGMASGDLDAFMDVWLPVTHQSYVEQMEGEIVEIGVNYRGARIGLVVPEYVEIDSILEINDYVDDFEGEIIGIDAGAGLMQATAQAIDEYELDYQLLEGSGAAMTASLQTAIRNNEPIIVTGWSPHWKFARWDLKYLEDPENVFGELETIYTYSRAGFADDFPEVADFLTNFELDDDQLGDLMGAIADSDEEAIVVAREWKEENAELVNTWLN